MTREQAISYYRRLQKAQGLPCQENPTCEHIAAVAAIARLVIERERQHREAGNV